MKPSMCMWVALLLTGAACEQAPTARAAAEEVLDADEIDGDAAPADPDALDAFETPPENPDPKASGPLGAAAEEIDKAVDAVQHRHEQDFSLLERERSELKALQGELDTRLKNIEKLEDRIDRLLGEGKVAAERHRSRIDVLANLVATMPPQAAATMVAQMSDAEAQDLLLSIAQVDKRKAAKLIAAMPAARAASISQRYLNRDPQTIARGPEPAPTPTPTPPTQAAPAPEAGPADTGAEAPPPTGETP